MADSVTTRRGAPWLLPASAAAVTVLIWTQVRAGGKPSVDRWARSWSDEHERTVVVNILDRLKDVASPAFAVPAILVAAAVLTVLRSDRRPLVLAGLSVLGLLATTTILKIAVARPGPSGVGPPAVDGAWPSGHATTIVVAVLVLVRLFAGPGTPRAAVLVPAVLVPPVVGIALVYCGHHWLTDVLVGIPLGYLVVRGADALTRTVGASGRSIDSPLGSAGRPSRRVAVPVQVSRR